MHATGYTHPTLHDLIALIIIKNQSQVAVGSKV
jgi:hypothetical protein